MEKEREGRRKEERQSEGGVERRWRESGRQQEMGKRGRNGENEERREGDIRSVRRDICVMTEMIAFQIPHARIRIAMQFSELGSKMR